MNQYFIYDVFTEKPFSGNQLAIIPDARGLRENLLQSIAREFNFSETTFVFPPKNSKNTAQVRIFTPTMEIPFAGHPIIGTAVALSAIGKPAEMTFELGVGDMDCHVVGNSATFTTVAPLDTLAKPERAIVAESLSLPVEMILGQPVLATLGLPFILAELTSQQALENAVPNIDGFRKGAAAYPTGLDFAIYCYVRNHNTVCARMFAPLDNIIEDPATGSAAATLTAFVAQKSGALELTIYQGDQMGRPSVIRTHAQNGKVKVTGNAIKTMEGKLCL